MRPAWIAKQYRHTTFARKQLQVHNGCGCFGLETFYKFSLTNLASHEFSMHGQVQLNCHRHAFMLAAQVYTPCCLVGATMPELFYCEHLPCCTVVSKNLKGQGTYYPHRNRELAIPHSN